MKKNDYLNALEEQRVTETNLKLVEALKYIYELLELGLINQGEFEFGKEVMFKNGGEKYKESYLNSIPILYKALQNRIIDDGQYHQAVHKTLSMNNDKYLAQLLYAKLIPYSDYNKSYKSQLVNTLFINDYIARIAILLTEKYNFRIIYSSIKSHKQTIILERGDNRYTTILEKGLFSKKHLITDEFNKTYSYLELIKKLNIDYGTL